MLFMMCLSAIKEPLHQACKYENSAAAYSLVIAGANFSAKSSCGTSALKNMVDLTPDAISSITKRLDSAIRIPERDSMDEDGNSKILIDFKVLIPFPDSYNLTRTDETALLTAIVDSDQCHLLEHPVIQTFLHLKWKCLRSLFVMALVFHAFFVGFLTTNILSVYMRCPEALQIANLTSTNEELCPITLATRNWRIVMLFMMCLSAIIEVSQLIPSPRKYIRCIEKNDPVDLTDRCAAHQRSIAGPFELAT